MKHRLFLFGLVSLCVFFGFYSAAFAGAVTSKEEIAIKTTGGGIKIQSNNGNSFSIGGRIMYDFDSYDGMYNFAKNAGSEEDSGNDASESEFRRTRINVKGTSGKNWGYKMTVDINEGDAKIDTAYLQYKGLGFTEVLLGRFNAPFGLEELTSSKWISTVERSAMSDLGFLNGKPSFQIALHGHSDRTFWQAAVIDEDREDEDGADAYSLAGRLGGHFATGENGFVHLAAAYASRNFGDEAELRFRSRMGVHTLSGRPFEAGKAMVDYADQFGLEAAGVFGPFSVQGEYQMADFDGANDSASDVDTGSYYVQASYMLTGESRGYKGKAGKFDKVSPKGTMGAWELVAKYEDGEVDIKNEKNEAEYNLLTLGVNWYTNKNVKFMLNYLDGDTDHNPALKNADDEDGKAVAFRAQYAF